MPLITITCHPDWYPNEDPSVDDPRQATTVSFAEELPQLFSDNAKELGMEPCPPDGVQVNFERFHARSVNSPQGLWVKVEMAEVLLTPDGRRDEDAELRVKDRLKELFDQLWKDFLYPPQFAVDIFWGPDHGWLDFGRVKIDW